MAFLDTNGNEYNLINRIIKEINISNYEIKEEAGSKKGDNYVGILRKLCIKGTKENNNKTTLNLIFKQAPSEETRRKIFSCKECFEREIFMFEKVLPTLSKLEDNFGIKNKLKYAKLYATLQKEGSECLVFNDLTVEGYEMKDRKLPLNLQHCLAVVKYHAKLHSLSFVLKKNNIQLFKSLCNIPETFFCRRFLEHYQNIRMKATIARVIACLDKEKENHLVEMVMNITGDFINIFEDCLSEKTANGYTVINHGDGWINNIFFKYQDKTDKSNPESVCFIDWQLSRLASPVIDLVYFLWTSTDKQFRKNHLQYVYEEYYSLLANNLEEYGEKIEDHFPYEEYHKHIKMFSKIGFLVAVMAMQVFMSNEDEVFDASEIVNDRENYEGVMMKKALHDLTYRERMHDIVEDFYELDLYK